MLAQMNSGAPFTIEVCSFDKKRKTGGELITYKNCVKHQAGKVETLPTAAPVQTKPNRSTDLIKYQSLIPIRTLEGSIRSIRTRLIVRFNNEEVSL